MSSFKIILAFLFWILFFFACTEKAATPTSCDCSFDPIDYQQRYQDKTDIHFMVTADPQYNSKEMNPDQPSAINADMVSRILAEKICCDAYRGVIISGDLTHFARLDEYARYKNFIKPFQPFVFDGLGNHDFSWANEDSMSITAFEDFGFKNIVPQKAMGWKEDCLTIWKDVRDRTRIPSVHSSYPNIHYSWDWEDVHCIQLNAFPGTNTRKGKPAQNPFNSLDFLKEDLEKRVGNSGRPVILSHHYGFDFFSLGAPEEGAAIEPRAAWWTSEDQERYWELLKPYNVIAIFSGHAHYCDNCYIPWDGKSVGEENVGTDFIPTFVGGAAREGKYLDCQITSDSLIVKRYSINELVFRKALSITRK